MKKRIVLIGLLLTMSFGLAGCKGADYNEALKLEELKDYSSAAEIFERLGEYKDSQEHLENCNIMVEVIDDYNAAKTIAENKNEELDTAISNAESLIAEDKPALDETLVTALNTAISEAKQQKISISEIPETKDEIVTITNDFQNIDYGEILLNLNDCQTNLEKSIKQYELVDNPSEEYIMECLKKVPNVVEISAVTEDNDPNGNLNKAGGYTAQVYFSSDLLDQEDIWGSTVIEKGTDCGGSIEVYSTTEDAYNRNDYLAAFDGGILSSGSHAVVGTVVVRTSYKLTATQQKTMESNIIETLTSIDGNVTFMQGAVSDSADNNETEDDDPRPQKNEFDEKTNHIVQVGNYAIQIPSYWKENTPSESAIIYRGYAETGGKTSMIIIDYHYNKEEPLTFEELRDDKDEFINSYSQAFSEFECTNSELYESTEIKGLLFDYTFTESGIDATGTHLIFASPNGEMININLVSSNNTDYKYDNDFTKIIASIKEIDENITVETKGSTSSANGVTPELKAFLDEYEAFWNDYVEFYKSYMDSLSSGDYLSMLSGYADMLEKLDEYEEKLDEMEKKLDEIDENELSAEDYAYYLEVTTRIYLKMLEMYQ